MYKIKYKPRKSRLTSTTTVEGESIERKVERIVQNKEPIKDGAPDIFTERADGVLSAYNIRTDKWEIATEAMDIVTKSSIAQGDGVIPLNPEPTEGGDTSEIGTAGGESEA